MEVTSDGGNSDQRRPMETSQERRLGDPEGTMAGAAGRRCMQLFQIVSRREDVTLQARRPDHSSDSRIGFEVAQDTQQLLPQLQSLRQGKARYVRHNT